ncbi:undecaprenyl-diphosphate phosphatase [Candidatus Saccharibacteria bacterium]|nr:undecaprenyl-diphosphate phosphatase [Candidatus Saccharibacteria bacterium]
MDVFQTLILGLVQGLTEFIPISSSGHLVIGQHFFIGESNHLFLEWINIGTLLALLVYFRKKILQVAKDCIQNRDYRLARNIILTALPAGIVGYLLADFIDSVSFFGSLVTVTVTLALVGFIMVILERLPKASSVQSLDTLSAKRALIIGTVQVAALIPGVSRSGSTIIAGRIMGLKPALAAEYSFLASLPIMIGVTIKLFASASDRQYFIDNGAMLVLSNGVAFLSGLIAVGFLMNYLSRHGLAVFGWYRIGLASVLAIILLIQSVE